MLHLAGAHDGESPVGVGVAQATAGAVHHAALPLGQQSPPARQNAEQLCMKREREGRERKRGERGAGSKEEMKKARAGGGKVG